MAIIYSYPEKTTPAGGDFLVITDSQQPYPNKNRTKSLTVDNLASYVITSTSAITGSGTLNTMAMFTPDGQKIGDSFMTYNPTSQFFVISKRLQIDGDLIVDGRGSFNGDYLRINCPLQDGNGLSGTAGQILTSTGTGVEWVSDSVYSWNITGDNGTSSTVASGNTVDISGGTNITTAADLTDTVTINLDDSITLAGTLTVNGDTVIGDAGTDTLTVNAETTFADNVTINGNLKSLKMGATSSLIFIDSGGTTRLTIGGNITNNSIINESGSGDLILVSNTEVEIKSGELGENFAKFTKDGPIELYYDNVKKFETSSNSIKILDVPVHADNAAASAAGLTVGEVYRTGDLLKIVH